jgi:hypothetical protein
MPTVTSPLGKIKWKEFLEGGIYAALLPAIDVITDTISAAVASRELSFDWKQIGILALSGFVAFVVKKLFTPAQVRISGLDKKTLSAIQKGTKKVAIKDWNETT